MRKPALLLVLVFHWFLCSAQTSPAKNSFKAGIAAVISDYPNQFRNLIGELLAENPQSADYRSRLDIKDAEECTVTRYSATGKEIYSWQALMLHTESFPEAAGKFKTYYQAINNLSMNINGTKIVFKENYIKPAEENKFTSIVFKPLPKENQSRKLRIELLLQLEMLEWTIRVLVYDKEREDDESGPVKE